MEYRSGDSVEVTGVVIGSIDDGFGNYLYQVCFNDNVVVAIPTQLIKLKGLNRTNFIDATEYKKGMFK